MSFGQPAGPPASFRQLEELTALLHGAGHRDFRDARGPMGFTQRQSAGKFTREEADAFIARLNGEESDRGRPDDAAETAVPDGPDPAPPEAHARSDRVIRTAPSEQLAQELERRGWAVLGPTTTRPREQS